jgi:hypothetical protein
MLNSMVHVVRFIFCENFVFSMNLLLGLMCHSLGGSYNAKFSTNASYQRYKNGTSLIIPWFPAPPPTSADERQQDAASTAPCVYFYHFVLTSFAF